MSESMFICVCFGIYFSASVAAFYLLPARQAAVVSFFGGWLFLPVAIFPVSTITSSYFTVDVIGVALPSNLGVTKAVVVPLAILIGISLRLPQLWTRIAFQWQDIGVLLFSVWPIIAAFLSNSNLSLSVISALYLAASWGGHWLIGRLLFTDVEGLNTLLEAISWSGIVLIPIAIVEGINGPFLYPVIYGNHSFLLEGSPRFVGHRPLGFFEHGNQYGIWIAMSAIASLLLYKRASVGIYSIRCRTGLTFAAALACQSAGALILMSLGALASFFPIMRKRTVNVGLIAVIAVSAGVYVSGAVPVEYIVRKTQIGQKAAELLYGSKRGMSLGYRIRRDQMAIPMIRNAPIAGYGHWDWWRPLGSHPWGLPLLIAGQFGVVALVFSMIGLLVSPIFAYWCDDDLRMSLAIIVLLAAVDACLNSYIYFPALVASGALGFQKSKRS